MNILFTIFLLLIPVFFLLTRWRRSSKRLPPGPLGIPIIGQSIGFLRAMRANSAEEWLHQRVRKHGPISKLILFGKPTVFIHGQAANKFVFNGDSSMITNQQNESIRMILGNRNLTELSGNDHKRVRDALLLFLKPESLKQYVGKMDGEVRKHLEMHWHGKQQVTVLPLMKILTFNMISSLLFGIEKGARRDKFLECFKQMIEGMWSVPLNLPFTRYKRGLKASITVQKMLKEFIEEKRKELKQGNPSQRKDLISCLLSMRNEDNEEVLTEKEIIHNVMLAMAAGYDTTSVLLTFIVRFLANEPAIYAAVVQEQEEIANSKPSGELLTWEDLAKMKYTWKVAMETLRMVPPVFGGFRKAVKDIEYGGYLIPEGWQIFWASSMTHMETSIFPEPSKFDPSRFEKQSPVPPYCFVAFGGGPRICPGNEFARIETLVAIHHLVTQFNWKLLADSSFCRDPAPVPAQGLPLQITSKKNY
ncbi:hypothetical protein FEM48_Zijuj01G0228700 [Ziziphus jujuba var. spinosa]|uniref:Cytochrome P450 716B1-like n=1 Tax=Ziziphus jujuba var. spinosa TaxID=714518 RepID=A0A978W409_ZIZJJ|nr:hypothetical protein FEM48_Zijuj01G0228700 [Ziziphus jujuba var. spinosa]